MMTVIWKGRKVDISIDNARCRAEEAYVCEAADIETKKSLSEEELEEMNEHEELITWVYEHMSERGIY